MYNMAPTDVGLDAKLETIWDLPRFATVAAEDLHLCPATSPCGTWRMKMGEVREKPAE